MTDKEIEKYLKEISDHPLQLGMFENKIDNKKEIENKEEFSERMTKLFNYNYLCNEIKLIKEVGDSSLDNIHIFNLTKKGRKVVRLGGWLKYLDRQDEIDKKKELKEDYELKIVEFQAKNPKLPYYISICGVIISLVSLFLSFKTKKTTSQHKKDKVLYILGDTILTKKDLIHTNYTDTLLLKKNE